MVINLLRFLVLMLLLGIVTVIGLVIYYSDLPDHKQLADYRPAMMTRIYAADNTLIGEYARQKRLFVPIDMIPERVKQAFLAAEDRSFYEHNGIDIMGIFRALWHNLVVGGPLQGASTITQQVAKNMLLTSQRTLTRKIKEALLAIRISFAFSKEEVLELYLNEIYLGAGAYGVAAAALNYFDKSLEDLTIEEAALIAAMPKAPTSYNPWRHYDTAAVRRNLVINAMEQEGSITEKERDEAIHKPIALKKNEPELSEIAGFFTEQVRRDVAEQYGDKKLYEGGLSVHTTLEPTLQAYAVEALRDGLVDYTRRHGYRGYLTEIPIKGNWRERLAKVELPVGAGDWKLAVVLKVDSAAREVEIGLTDGSKSHIAFEGLTWMQRQKSGGGSVPLDQTLRPGQVVPVEKVENQKSAYGVRQIPEVNGAVVVMDPNTGDVLAMVGGFDFKNSKFNRAVQAKRQPGSAFKPFVHLAAMEYGGITPASLIADEPIAFGQQGSWSPRNSTGRFYGATTLRRGLEKSLNVLTVHLAKKVGLNNIVAMAEKFGVADITTPDMTTVLGTTEVSLMDITAGYGMLVNGGKKITPSLFHRIHAQDGEVIYQHSAWRCANCDTEDNEDMAEVPILEDKRKQLVSPESAYQVVSMLRGVVERGTGRQAKILPGEVAGKTGTTNNSRDAWFIGFTADLVVGVYVGFDVPKPLGRLEEGSSLALPIFVKFMEKALKDRPAKPFPMPKGIRMVSIDANTGFLPSAETEPKDIILEAFKAGTEPTTVAPPTEQLPVLNPLAGSNSDKLLKVPTMMGTGALY